jgi:hypothetical protein
MSKQTQFQALPVGQPVPGVSGFRLYPSGKETRDEARAREVDRLLEKHGIRPRPRRTARSTMATLRESLAPRTTTVRRTQPVKRTAATAKTPPAIYFDPVFSERQRQAWEQRHAIVRHFASADIRVR